MLRGFDAVPPSLVKTSELPFNAPPLLLPWPFKQKDKAQHSVFPNAKSKRVSVAKAGSPSLRRMPHFKRRLGYLKVSVLR